MLILSWNVAGLSTTVHRIYESYHPPHSPTSPPSSASSLSASKQQIKTSHVHLPSACFESYLERHQADIICLQEHKIPKQQLTCRSEPRQCSSLPGYESFWSCCVDERRKGMNGVVTYARKGCVLAADSMPLGSTDLDQQGRCVMTDHGGFVVFNVYAPTRSGSLANKIKFHQALQRAMQHQRLVFGKAVILVGDLNIAYTSQDIFWKDRRVYVNDILGEVAAAAGRNAEDLPAWKRELAQHWQSIEAALQTKEVVETQTTNSLTREKYDKYRLSVIVDNKRIFLGSHETSPDYCLHWYDFDTKYYVHDETDERLISQEGNAVRVQILAELMSKIAGVRWDESVQRIIAETHACIDRISPFRAWLREILEEDGMVDAFRHFYPGADSRFTCWHQFTNRRYVNDGSRIDYTIVDRSLLPHIRKGDVKTLRCCGELPEGQDPLGEAAALRAATANGLFEPASFEGGGIGQASQQALDTQFGAAHTGMIYTPPSFSDHIAISLLMDDTLLRRELVLKDRDAATRKAQPHKVQQSIASFFTNGFNGSTSSPSSTPKTSTISPNHLMLAKRSSNDSDCTGDSSKRRKPSNGSTKKPSANSIMFHFRKQN